MAFAKGAIPWNKGKKCSQQTRLRMSESNLKNPRRYWLGKKRPDIAKLMSLVTKGRILSEEHKQKISIAQIGENHYRWIKDRTKVKLDKERGGPLHKQWSQSVKKRDGWKCRIADENCSGKVIAHHILSWRDYVELRYKINNGITLCHAHHPRKRVDEAKLSPFFQELVAKGN